MTSQVETPPMSGISLQMLPQKVHRDRHLMRPHARRLCKDNRAYVHVPYTIKGDIALGDYSPMWRAEHPFWIAKITANVGKHDNSTHPNDGCPIGNPLQVNMRRITADLTSEAAILGQDDRIEIASGHHQDKANASEGGILVASDFNVTALEEGDHVYVRVSGIGSDSPGTDLVVTLILVPIR